MESETLVLDVSILLPERLNYAMLFSTLVLFRNHAKRFPDYIEFSAPLLKRFRDIIGSERPFSDVFLGVPCRLRPDEAMSHNLVRV